MCLYLSIYVTYKRDLGVMYTSDSEVMETRALELMYTNYLQAVCTIADGLSAVDWNDYSSLHERLGALGP